MKRILFIEDDALVRESVCRGLMLLGYTVLTFESGQDALHHIKEETIDVVICNESLSDMQGTEFLLTLNGMEHRPHTVVVAGGTRELQMPHHVYLQMVRRLGANAILKKPYSLKELESVIDGLDGNT